MKITVNKLDVDKLVPVSVDLSKLSNVVKNDVVKKDVYHANIKDIEDKIPNITNLAAAAALNTKINEVKNEISSITNLAINTVLINVKNKTPNVSDLVKKKVGYDAEIKFIKNKYFNTSNYNKFRNNIFDAKIAQKKIVNESSLNEKK